MKSFYDWDWQTGEQHFRKAIELDAGLGTAQAWFAHALSARNRNDEAGAVLAKALENEPASPAVHVVAAQTLLQVGRRKEALEVCLKAFDLDPHLAIVSWALGLINSKPVITGRPSRRFGVPCKFESLPRKYR